METMSDALNAFDEMLNDTTAWPTVASQEFAPSDILRELDPLSYRSNFFDWADAWGIDINTLEDDADLPD